MCIEQTPLIKEDEGKGGIEKRMEGISSTGKM